MPLYHVQDPDRPLWVVAKNYQDAIDKWKRVIAVENDDDLDAVDDPQGIAHICDDNELIITEGTNGQN